MKELPNEPKTPHEEVMFVVESTNDIVSKILEILEKEANDDWNAGYNAGFLEGTK